ncbi:MAG: hypothetical protein KC933_28880, partial [Myxococcales bacterium]|nr:hypothetical protein [Myxococcales bacterium]
SNNNNSSNNNNNNSSNNNNSGPDAGTNPSCDDVSGTWRPSGANTCILPQDRCVFTQSDCTVELACSNGAFSVEGAVDDNRLDMSNGTNRCTGQVTGDSMDVSCQGPDIPAGQCAVVLLRGGGGATEEITGSGTCETGGECNFTCSAFGCQQICGELATCTNSCAAGGCEVECLEGSSCDVGCSGGGCQLTCREGADCTFSCSGGGCNFTCETSGQCLTSCSGGGCNGG